MYANINLISRLGYSSVPYCRGSNCTFWGKKTSTSFNYYKSDLKTPPPIKRNLGNFPPGAFYSTPPPPPP